jgi:bifunctional non-homologous end joining protein LigD
LRHASFQGLREDKPAEEVVAEVPEKADTLKPAKEMANGKARQAHDRGQTHKPRQEAVAGCRRHQAGLAELLRTGVAAYGAFCRQPAAQPGSRAGWRGRPPLLSEACFARYERGDPAHEGSETGDELLYIENFDGLAALVQYGCVEVHLWGSTIDSIEQPDQIVFDLDPDEGLDVQAVRDATLDVKSRLDEVGLPAFVKTSGGKGFHIVVPLKPSADWAGVKTFAHDFAHAMEQSDADRYTATLSKKARTGRIFIDYLRNGRGSTTVAPWSSRGKEKATVSVPVPWDALKKKIAPDAFTVGGKALADALEANDEWADFDKARKALKA